MVKPSVQSKVLVPEGTPHGTLFVCVAGSYGKGIVSEATGCAVSLEDCARGYWKDQHLAQSHADECEWLMAHCGGEIKGVWKIDRRRGKNGWLSAAQVQKPTWPDDSRTDYPASACHLIPVDQEMQRRFVGKTVHLGNCWNPLRGYFKRSTGSAAVDADDVGFDAVALEKRLKGKSVMWMVGDEPVYNAARFWACNEILSLRDCRRLDFEPDVFLVADDRTACGEWFFCHDDCKPFTFEANGVAFTLRKTRDYGKIGNLDLNGGFAFYDMKNEMNRKNLGRVVEYSIRYKEHPGSVVKKKIVVAAVECMEFAARFLVADRIRMSALCMGGFHCGFNGTLFAGSWPAKIAAALGATKMISDKCSIKHFSVANQCFSNGCDLYEKAVEKYPYLADLPDAGIVHEICQLQRDYSLYEIGVRDGAEDIANDDIMFESMAQREVAVWDDSEKLSPVPMPMRKLRLRREAAFL